MTTGFLLLDTTDPLAAQRITGQVERDTTGGKAVYFHDDVTSPRRYLALTAAGTMLPSRRRSVISKVPTVSGWVLRRSGGV